MASFKCEFSEINFTFSFLHEYLSKLPSRFPPFCFLPTQREEYDLGFDAQLWGYPIFFQFKRPGNYGKSKCFQGKKCFSFYFERNNRPGGSLFHQNDLLYNLYSKGFRAVYIAPLFYKMNDFLLFSTAKSIIDNSRFLEPVSVGTAPLCLGRRASNSSCASCSKAVSHKYLYDQTDQVVCSDPIEANFLFSRNFLLFTGNDFKEPVKFESVIRELNHLRNGKEQDANPKPALGMLAKNDITFLFLLSDSLIFK